MTHRPASFGFARLFLLGLMAIAIAHCGDSSEAAEPAQSTASSGGDPAATEPVAPNTEPAPAPAEEPPPAIVAAPEPPPVHEGVLLVRRILAEDGALAAAIDPVLGLTLVRYEEAAPNSRGARTQQHVCVAQLTRKRAQITAMLRAAVEQSVPEEEWQCTENECVAPGMEWTPAVHVRFARNASGALVVEALLSISEAALGEEWLEAATAYVDRALTTSRAHPCTH